MDERGAGPQKQLASVGVAVALAAWWLVSALAYARLPALMPTHFTLSGAADGPLRAPGATWFLFPAIATLTYIALEGSLRTAVSNPSLLNLPHKDEYLRLDAPERSLVLRDLRDMTNLIALCVGVTLAALQWGVYDVAQDGASQIGKGPMLIMALALASIAPAVLRGYLRLNRRLAALADASR